jgi:hypothetical protein
MERIEEEDEKEEDEDGSEDGSGSEGSGAEFIPSTWDSTATPTKSAIKSPASLVRHFLLFISFLASFFFNTY